MISTATVRPELVEGQTGDFGNILSKFVKSQE